MSQQADKPLKSEIERLVDLDRMGPSGAALEIYTQGNVKIAGNGVLNSNDYPVSLQIWGTATSTTPTQTVDIAGNGALTNSVAGGNLNNGLTNAGTIFTAAEEVEKAGGKALPLPCDIRDEQSVEKGVAETVAKFGTDHLLFTLPLPIYGLFRYLHLIHRGDGHGNPSDLLLSDRALQASILLWALLVAAIIYGPLK